MDRLGTGRLTEAMTEHPILVTGATGKSGRRVVSRLRAEGLRLFPAERGVTYRRGTGLVVGRHPAARAPLP